MAVLAFVTNNAYNMLKLNNNNTRYTTLCLIGMLNLATVAAPTDVAIGNLFNVLLEDYSQGKDNVVFIKSTIPKDFGRYNSLVHESLPSNQEEAANLVAARESNLSYLKTGLRWNLIEEISDGCNLILLNRDCDYSNAGDGGPPTREVELYLHQNDTDRLSGFGSVSIFESTGLYGYRIANYFPEIGSVITSFADNPPAAARLGLFHNLEPELTFLVLSACQMTGPQFAKQSRTNCHPSLYNFSNFHQDNETLATAIANNVITATAISGLERYSIQCKIGKDLNLLLQFTPNDKIRFPNVQVTEGGTLLRTITRRIVTDQPWFAEWTDEKINSSRRTNFVTRYFMKSEIVNVADSLSLFNDMCVKNAKYKTTKASSGETVTTQETDSGRKIIVGRSQASILTQPRRNALILFVIVVSALFPLFLNYKKLRSK